MAKKTPKVIVEVDQQEFNSVLSTLSSLSGGLPIPVHNFETGQVNYVTPAISKKKVK